ncbi:CO dehydrogenase maturation factor [Candidatus Electrothrix communis]|uniref:CO dehydrogenase maturation factor n=1 Tax=Candidatus Electrothrix communis TaxID=1859133 RepID=A0A444J8I5_9BACT|nr:AAA family ATPase [Desulfobulbus sp. US4]MCW5205060.1 AAA family ATPase [Desulfobulbus sp. N2]RWX49369.1 CO dehydrogenase maturation factor [Candidatus Electrothrix communis]WLE97643.1 MAG: AAA family ATPase [Candidatus Electrothrix communis]
MTKVIALAGKGGTGKTTTSALLLKYLVARKMTPVLAVDADANANLNELVGLDVQTTLGQIRKELKGDMPTGMSRDQYMEMKIHQALIEETGFDLMVMGQPDGPGCYCAANQYLAMTMDKLAENYKYIIVDNEAGMEHLSRMNLCSIDYLLIVSDPSARGIMTARRIADITGPLKLEVKHQYLLVNRAPDPVPPALQAKIDEAVAEADMDLAGIVSSSDDLIDQELSGASYLELAEDSKVIEQVFAVFDAIFEDAS